jgi:TPR repeat protein
MLQDMRKAGGDRAPAAAAELGEFYLTGVSTIAPDPDLARQFLEEAADAGDQGAALRLGRALLDGKLLPGDRLEGVTILSELSAQGGRTAARAGRELGAFFLAAAKSDPASAQKARFYLEGAANKGDETARFYLGEALLTGAGLPQDLARGEELLLEVAATPGPFTARAHFALAVHQLSVPSRAAEAREHLEAAATAGLEPARLRLGQELLSGAILAPEPKTALKLLEQLSSENGAEADAANLLLGNFFLNGGAGTKPNPAKARLYLEKAADKKPKLLVNLGRSALAGELGPADGAQALAYFEKAEASGISDAAVYVARVYLNGAPGVARNVGKGITLLEQTAASGNAFAAREIIAVYRGDGVKNHKRDLDKARAYFEAFKSIGASDEVLSEEALLSIAATTGDLEGDSTVFNRIPASRQGDAIRRVLSIEPKAAVYITQQRLKSAGLYTAGLDGVAGRGTLGAIAKACGVGQPDACGSKPLQGKTLDFIVTNYPLAAAASN